MTGNDVNDIWVSSFLIMVRVDRIQTVVVTVIVMVTEPILALVQRRFPWVRKRGFPVNRAVMQFPPIDQTRRGDIFFFPIIAVASFTTVNRENAKEKDEKLANGDHTGA